MSKLTLDLNGLNVESFSPEGMMGAAHEPTTGTMTYAFSCVDAQNGTVADTFVCAGVAALTDVYPCKTTR